MTLDRTDGNHRQNPRPAAAGTEAESAADAAAADPDAEAASESTPAQRRAAFDARIRTAAEDHGGVVCVAELRALGLSVHAIAHRCRRGALVRLHQGVYAVGHVPTEPAARAHAALLAIGPRSALSHASAATFWGIYPDWREPFHVTTPLHRAPRRIVVHRTVTLRATDVHTDPTTGLRVTSAARTALDLVPQMSQRRAIRMVNDLRVRRKVTVDQLVDVMAHDPRHAGIERLRRIVLGSQREPTRSELENVFLRIVERYGLPTPVVNQHVEGERVDFFFPDPAPGVVVEVDSYTAHSDPQQFAADRRRDRTVWSRRRIPTLRFTYDDCVDAPATVHGDVRAALEPPG